MEASKRVVVIADPGLTIHPNRKVGLNGLPDDYNGAVPTRQCFWPNLELSSFWKNQHYRAPECETFCISEYPRASEIFDGTGLLIVNWDAANGDPLYRSEVTLNYFSSRASVHIDSLLADGGVVLIESQAAHNRPVQEPYDAICGSGEVTVGYDLTTEKKANLI